MMTAAYIFSAWIAADIATGAFHWWEDRYGDPSWPIIGPLVVQPNILHHRDPRAFLSGNYWTRNSSTIVPAALIATIAAAAGQWWIALVAAIGSQANEIHGWAHQRCSRPIRGLQLLGVLHSPDQHAVHHQRPFDKCYCVISDWSNPVLSLVGFWSAAEWMIGLFGPRPRTERSEA
jgi:hypothetical protein